MSVARTAVRSIAATVVALSLVGVAAAEDPRYIVKFANDAPGRAALSAAGGRIVLELGPQGAAAAHLPARALEALKNNPHIEYIEEDVLRVPFAQIVPYGIPMVQADQLSDAQAGNRKVCIIDSGYSLQHEDLAPNSSVVTGTNVTGTGNWFEDSCGHGSHVAGTIAAYNNGTGVIGVAPNGKLKLHIVKVFDGASCGWTYSSSLVAAANICQSAGANVISMSLGGTASSRTEKNAFASYESAGILSVAAAGNDGTSSGTVDALSYPASYPSVVSVAAVDANKVHATFSQENSSVALSAPGVGVISTVPFGGTHQLTLGGNTLAGFGVEGAAATTISGINGTVADGGICDSVGAWGGKVVLCQRGTVSFAIKVANVQSGGGAATVIYNNVAGDLSATLGTSASTIPAISLSDTQGATALFGVGTSGNVVNFVAFPASGYEAYNGTSMATPHVAAVAAVVWSSNPTWTNAQVRQALQVTAEDLGAPGRDISYGYGLIRGAAARDYALSAFGGPPTPDTTPPVINNITAKAITGGKPGRFTISWQTNEASTTVVTLTPGGTTSNATLVTSHSVTIGGTKGQLYSYTVSSTDAAGNTSTSAVQTFQN